MRLIENFSGTSFQIDGSKRERFAHSNLPYVENPSLLPDFLILKYCGMYGTRLPSIIAPEHPRKNISLKLFIFGMSNQSAEALEELLAPSTITLAACCPVRLFMFMFITLVMVVDSV